MLGRRACQQCKGEALLFVVYQLSAGKGGAGLSSQGHFICHKLWGKICDNITVKNSSLVGFFYEFHHICFFKSDYTSYTWGMCVDVPKELGIIWLACFFGLHGTF
jgi:hypothetical protein